MYIKTNLGFKCDLHKENFVLCTIEIQTYFLSLHILPRSIIFTSFMFNFFPNIKILVSLYLILFYFTNTYDFVTL